MMRSLYSGVTGLSTHQTRMDVIGNNIANVNTVGYKKAAVTFKDLYSETMSSAAAPTTDGTSGGVNPKQIGLGVTVNSITNVMTAGAASYTGNTMDLAISGDGFFAVSTQTGIMYTRAGNMTLDEEGNLITATGNYVQTIEPILSSESRWVVAEMFTDTLFIPGGDIEGPVAGSQTHTGNISAELEGADGRYTFSFASETPRLAPGTMSSFFRPSINETGFSIVADASHVGGNVNTASFASAYIAAAGDINNGGGDLPISFVLDGTDIAMLLGGVTIGTCAGTDMDFAGVMNLNVSLAAGVTAAPSQDQVLIALNEMAEDWPDIAIEENGTWNLVKNDGTIVEENIKVDTQTDLNDQISNGEMIFSTQGYGTFRLSLNNEDIKSAAGISAVFNDPISKLEFELTVAEEPYAVYSGISGEITQDSLQNFQIDFDKYTSMTIDQNGAIIAQLKNADQITIDGEVVERAAGEKVVLGYIPLTNFNNPAGLEKIGDNLYAVTANSGEAVTEMAGTGNVGKYSTSALEMSNVDLSEEMVNMIITQRGFQANSRIITTSDAMLEEIVNLKR